ncbi:MAG: hypothetical protein EA401_00135 [Planctomycetota bacterium]|nr:MAG: hypothetical protein EA401_00135 [Planctomycetota bacterium]
MTTDPAANSSESSNARSTFYIVFATAAHPEVGCLLPGDFGGMEIFADGAAAEAYIDTVTAAMTAIENDCGEWNDSVDAYEDGDEGVSCEWEGRTRDETVFVWGEWAVEASDKASLCQALDHDMEEVLRGNLIDGSDDEERLFMHMC